MEQMTIHDAIKYGIKYAKKQKAKQVEGHGSSITSVGLEVEKGRPSVSNGINKGCSFRVIYDNNIGFAFTTNLTQASIEQAIKSAIGNAKVRGPDSVKLSFPEPVPSTEEVKFDQSLLDVDISDIGDYYDQIREPCEASNLNFLGAQLMFSVGDMIIHNSKGLEVEQKIGFIGGGAFLLSLKGLIPSWGGDFTGSRNISKIDWTDLGNRCVSEVKKVEGPKTINYSGEVPVIFQPDALGGIFGGLLNVLTTMLRGDSLYQKSTYYADRIGEEVAVADFSYIDDGLHDDGLLSSKYDHEGVPTTTLPLIENGVLKNFLLDSYYASKLETESNGKCSRFGGFGGFNPIKQSPGIGSYTSVIAPGDASYEEMVQETMEGFSINNVMGVHMSDYASGRFSVTGSGHFIKNGVIKYPVQDIAISGDIPSLLQKIDMVGKEPKIGFGSVVPPLRISSLSINSHKMSMKYKSMLLMLKVLTTLKLMKHPIAAD
ncbi:MAG: TldD/PmbA family protein [Candidatus Kariarchaeaceae archaeon]